MATSTVNREQDAAASLKPLPVALPRPLGAGLVFSAAGAVLMLEILAVRLLGPYVGLTLETTTSIIGAVLAGIAAGAAIGGYFADRTDTLKLVVGLFVAGGVLTLLIVPTVRWLGPGARDESNLAALGITAVALVPAAVALSAISPAIAHLQLHDLRASGTVIGRLSAWGTAGALVGTFGTGFVIVPLLPVSTAVLAIGIVLILVGIGLGGWSRVVSLPSAVAILVVVAAAGTLTANSDSPCGRETSYHCATVEAVPGYPGGYELILDGERNSFVDVNDPTVLGYRYTNWIADSIDADYPGGRPLDVVFVGGAGFSLPRWLDASRPGSHAQVLEVDGELVDLDEEELGLELSPQLEATVGDGRVTMRNVPDASANVVVGDAFSGLTVPWHLTTAEWIEEVKRVLEPGGLYALNMVDYAPHDLLKAEAATMLDQFREVRMVTPVAPNGQPIEGNAILLGSDRQMAPSVGSSAFEAVTFDRSEVEAFAGGAEPLRDDYAPVDQLLTIHR